MGLTQADTTAIKHALGSTMDQVNTAILAHGGFSTRMMPSYAVHAYDDPALDPRQVAKQNDYSTGICIKYRNPTSAKCSP